MFLYNWSSLFPRRGGVPDQPGNIVVDTPLDIVNPDDGLTSLREAVMDAESNPAEPATITFDATVFNIGGGNGAVFLEAPIELSTEVHIDGMANGRRVTITGDVEGDDPTTTVSVEPFRRGAAQDYDITDLTGYEYGVSTFLDDNTNLFVVSNGEAHFENLVLTGGAALGDDDIGDAGAILLSGAVEVQVENSLLGGNIAIQDGGAVSIFSPYGGAQFEVLRSQFYGNLAGNDGGAVYVSPNEEARFEWTSFEDNEAGIPGLYESSDDGGALANFGTTIVKHSSFVGNRAGIIPADEFTIDDIGAGGAIFNQGELVVGRSQFIDNAAFAAGAILNFTDGELDIRHSLIADNRSGFDAALTNFGETTARGLVVTGNDRGVENAALDDGFGLPVEGTGIMRLRNSFIFGNEVDLITDLNDPDEGIPSGTVSQPIDLSGFNLIGEHFSFGNDFIF